MIPKEESKGIARDNEEGREALGMRYCNINILDESELKLA